MQEADPINVIYRLRKSMQAQMDALIQTLANGGVDSMDEYKYIIGQIRSSEDLQQDLTDLLKKQEPDDDTDTGEGST